MPRATVACGNNTLRKANTQQQQRALMLWAHADGNLVRLTEKHQDCISLRRPSATTIAQPVPYATQTFGFGGGQRLCQRWYPGRPAVCSQTSLNTMGGIEGMGSRAPSRNPPNVQTWTGRIRRPPCNNPPLCRHHVQENRNRGKLAPFHTRIGQRTMQHSDVDLQDGVLGT